jgi:glycosyltransferase involved in cell wall biosynthesis
VNLAVLSAVLRVRPDIVHVNSFYAAAAALLPAFLARRRAVIHARDFDRFALLWRFFGVMCEKVIAVSAAVKGMLVGRGVSGDKIVVIHNGVHIGNTCSGADCRGRMCAGGVEGGESFVFAHVGQLVRWKNHADFVEAASIVSRELKEARFVVVGDDVFGREPRYGEELRCWVRSLPVGSKFRFLGWQRNMDEVWPDIDCLVHTAEREPFGRVIIEAMAHKVPVIAAGSCGPGEIIRDGETGILYEPGDIEQLSAAMLEIVRDRRFAQGLAEAAYEAVRLRFSAEQTAARVEQIYEEVIGSG